MRRIKLIIAVAMAVAVMMVAAAPAMANMNIGGTNGSFVAFSAQNFGGGGNSDSDFGNNVGFLSLGNNSSTGDVDFDGGSNGGFSVG